MHTKQITGVCLAILVLILPFSADAEEQRGQLPPGVQKYPGKGNVEKISYNGLMIYTNDGVEKVMDFYRKALQMEPVSANSFLLGSDLLKPGSVSEADESIYLWVSSARDRNQGSLDADDVFEIFEEEIQWGKTAGGNAHSEQELQQIKEKYAHLVKAWYPDFDVREELSKCQNKRQDTIKSIEGNSEYSEQGMEQAAARIEQLMAEGKQQEAMLLVQSIGAAGARTGFAIRDAGSKDYWDSWVGCLDEVDTHDFQIAIGIGLFHFNFVPSTQAQRQEAAD